MKRTIWTAFAAAAVFLAVFTGTALAKTFTLGIVPFSVTPEQNAAYMNPAIMDLFASRLALKNSVTVVDKPSMLSAYNNDAKDPLTRMMDAGKKVKADYILTGSLSETETGSTLNAYVLDIATGKPVAEVTGKNRPNDVKGDVIPLIDQVAAQINKKLFSRSEPEDSEPMKNVTPANIHAHPDKLIKTIPKEKK